MEFMEVPIVSIQVVLISGQIVLESRLAATDRISFLRSRVQKALRKACWLSFKNEVLDSQATAEECGFRYGETEVVVATVKDAWQFMKDGPIYGEGLTGYAIADLRSAGFSFIQIRKLGFTVQHWKDSGFTDYTLADLYTAGYNLEELRRVGHTAQQIKDAGFSASQAHFAGFTFRQLVNVGYDPIQLTKAGFTVQMLRSAGYQPTDIIHALQENGYNLEQAMYAGVSVQELKAAGCSVKDIFDALLSAGYNLKQVKEAGLTERELIGSAKQRRSTRRV